MLKSTLKDNELNYFVHVGQLHMNLIYINFIYVFLNYFTTSQHDLTTLNYLTEVRERSESCLSQSVKYRLNSLCFTKPNSVIRLICPIST